MDVDQDEGQVSPMTTMSVLQPGSPILHTITSTVTFQAWQIDARTIRLCRKPDGRLWKLGEGGFGQVACTCTSTSEPMCLTRI